ncbi:hypothetical protein PCC7424_0657 [Gloeothece citriformis PCC 7424]|uniref:DUF4168 domain-containing protein n=1 Tax=Gloeothece citriformis (strain PCC 7424) TaxID=65393 RepID=B7KEU1_GLOC7|nr:DUF4168 domain-containing protein [Gloeothece citriformis]ACK69116.1 hypothetical protein PCC7424_0657 [Gloeothece citriformis PCC 7424]
MPFNLNKTLPNRAIASTTLILVSLLSWAISPVQAEPVNPKTLITQASGQNISNKELQQFAQIIQKVYTVEQETTEKMVVTIQEEGMSIDRFNDIVKWKKNSQESPNPSVSDAEMQTFDKLVTKIAQLQEQADTKIKEIFTSQELQIDRFNQILEAVRQDPSLQSQVQQILAN